MRVLFVCGGNTCRSPMAVAIMRALFPSVHADSAGIAPHGSGATADAREVFSNLYGIDLTTHRPRDVRDVRLADFDLVVTVDTYVARELQDTHPNIVKWSVVDPYLQGREAYETCARQLERFIRELVGAGKENPGKSTCDLDAYQATVTRWLKEIESGDLRGTLLHGIAAKAAKQFELLLREFLQRYMDSQGIIYDRDVRAKVKGKKNEGLDVLTLGQLIEVLYLVDSNATKALVDAEARTTLGRVLSNRNSLQHEQRDESELVVLAKTLLGDIGEIIERILLGKR